MLHHFDTTRWLLLCLPPILRKPVLFALFSTCMQPLKTIAERCVAYAEDVNTRLMTRSYMGSLEVFLNNLFWLPQGTIYLADSIDDTYYLFYKTEYRELNYLYTKQEDNAPYLFYQPKEEFHGVYVNIPERIATETNIQTISKWIEYYKLAGVEYKIMVYE